MFEIKKFRKNLTNEEYKKIIEIFGNKMRLGVFLKNIAKPSLNYAEEKEFIIKREKELIPLIKNKKTLIQFGEFVSKTNLFVLNRLLIKKQNEKLANLLIIMGGQKTASLFHEVNLSNLIKIIKYTNPKQLNELTKRVGVKKTGQLINSADEIVVGGVRPDSGIYELGKLINMIGGDAVGKIVVNSHTIVVGRILAMIDAKPIAELTKILGPEKTGKFMLNAGDMETKEMLSRIGGKRLGKIIFHTGDKLSELVFLSGATKTGELFQKIGTENSILLLKQTNIKTIKNFLSYSSGMALGNLIKKTGVTKATNFMESVKNYQNVELFLEYGAFSIQKDSNLKQLYRRFNTLQFNKNELLVLTYLHRNHRVKKMVELINKKTPLTIRERDELVQNKLFLEKFVQHQKLKNLKNGGLRGTSLRTLFNLEKAFEKDNKKWKFDVPLSEKDVLALARKKEKGLGLKEISFSYKSENFSLNQNEKAYVETLLKKFSNTQNKYKTEATSLLKYLRTKQFNQPNPEYIKELIKQPIQSEKIFKEILKIYLKTNPKKTKEIISLGLFLFVPPNKKLKPTNDLFLLENIYNKKIMEFLKEAGINKNPYGKEIKNLQNIIKRINTQKPQEKKFVLDSRKDFRDASPGALGESCFNYSEFNMVADTKKFNLIKLIDTQTGRAEGVIHAHTIEKEGKKILMITGFELKNRVVNNSRTGILRTKKILDGIKKMAQKNGYSNVMITTEPYAISNRDAIKKYFVRNYKEMELKHKIYGSTVKTARNIAKIKPIEPKMRQRRK